MQNNFEHLLENVETRLPRRIWATPKGDAHETIKKLHEEAAFDHLCTITGLENGDNFEVLYHLSQKDTGILLTLRLVVPIAKPDIKTISDIFPSAVWYERELKDLLGINVEGLPKGNRYPLPEDWPQDSHPLRKNWKPEETK
ncbi:MAG: NADH-quinone oxidoreductase subunit C [Elusimicrobiota bacterium]|jgi:NADH:ubiquinone oxidoreductase subunit C|nr:NADH-quinone oxidoreductase subunit C [Elusimicrobiota bacterium]